jgi:hypothetical protein
MQTYRGTCHCGAVQFAIQADLEWYLPTERFQLLKGGDHLVLYQFNKKIAKHYFCRHCGIHVFRHPRSYPDAFVANVRCLDDFDLETAKYEVSLFDGRNWEAAQEARLKKEGRPK